MGIQKRNLLTEENACTPNYTPTPEHRRIEVYYCGSDVIIIGRWDNNYIGWLSVTKLSDDAANRQIVDYLRENKLSLFGHEYIVLQKTGYSWEKVKSAYSTEVRWGSEVMSRYREAQEMCRFREADGKYLNIMQYYLNILTAHNLDPMKDYDSKKLLIRLIRSEDYLRCSESKAVRDLYHQLSVTASGIYNDYMTAAH